MEVKVLADEDPYFKVGDEGLFFILTHEDSVKPVPPSLLNPGQAYVGIDWDAEVATFNFFDDVTVDPAVRSFDANSSQRTTFGEIKAIIEAY